MATVDKSVLVPHSVEQMFALVDAVESYPTFLPWCAGASIVGRTDAGPVARIEINFRGVHAHFTTENRNVPPESIHMSLRDGPFRLLQGAWQFHRLADNASKVGFTLQYEFATRVLEALIGPVFDNIADSFVDAFVKRADAVYGPPA
jgi:ribosome-associated toxin RatA of RatAB toxin-antitoxin module